MLLIIRSISVYHTKKMALTNKEMPAQNLNAQFASI